MTESDQGTARRGFGGASARRSGGTSTNGSSPAQSKSGASSRTAERSSNRSPSTGPKSATGRTPATRAGREERPASGKPAASTAPVAKKGSGRKPRRAQLRLSQVDAWSVMKTAFLLSIALGIVTVVAVGIVWSVLGAAGVFDSLNSTVQTVMGNSFQVQDYIGTGRVLGFTMLVAVVDVVLLTAIATLTAFLYNLAATLLGGVELTLTEDG